jgi:hypothetical protein
VNRADLEHLICSAAVICGDDDLIVIGSQALLASFPDAPASMRESMEADIYPRGTPEDSEKLILIGEGSAFHDLNGYYAEGVSDRTAKLPDGWESRLVPIRASRADGRRATGWCLEMHDLVAAKCAARRDRDWTYAQQALRYGLVDPDVLWARAQTLPLAPGDLEYVLDVLRGLLGPG